ncbi:MAG TPA: NUDIX domain-containing protein [Vicinamibacterales bacterium]|nr:NUDIX domain-containing protein [Vicinamibacterales bacterium]
MPPTRQGGAIAVRDTAKGPEVLLVRAKKDPRQWIFPKGHQERGETLAETAVRELKEEGGIVGEAVKSIGVSTFRSGGEEVEVTYFLVRDTGRRKTAEREVAWRRFAEAQKLVSFDDAQWLLEKAQQMLRSVK